MTQVIKKTLAVIVVAALAGLYTTTSMAQSYTIKTIADGLAFPWSLEFLTDGDILLTERDGRLRLIENGQLHPDPIAGVPETFVRGQGGLMDLRKHPDFDNNQLLYLSYSHGTRDANQLRVARARLSNHALHDFDVIFAAEPLKDTPVHYGARLAFLPDGTLLITVGDGFTNREWAQVLDNHLGKTVRVNDDGSIPADNPFVTTEGARPEIWTYGHRNQQGLLVDPTNGRVYLHEHGPMGGDELNVLDPGKNYGWPVATYGLDYSGARISPFREWPGMTPPMEYWVPSIAPGGLAMYQGDAFPAWQGDLFVAALANMSVRRLDLENGEIRNQETLFADLGERFREVRAGPDGFLYLLTDSPEGSLLQVQPR